MTDKLTVAFSLMNIFKVFGSEVFVPDIWIHFSILIIKNLPCFRQSTRSDGAQKTCWATNIQVASIWSAAEIFLKCFQGKSKMLPFETFVWKGFLKTKFKCKFKVYAWNYRTKSFHTCLKYVLTLISYLIKLSFSSTASDLPQSCRINVEKAGINMSKAKFIARSLTWSHKFCYWRDRWRSKDRFFDDHMWSTGSKSIRTVFLQPGFDCNYYKLARLLAQWLPFTRSEKRNNRRKFNWR